METRTDRPSSTRSPRRRGTAASSRVVRLELPSDLYPYQLDFINDPRPDVATVSTAQIGKTESCALWILKKLLETPGLRGWWVAPTYLQVDDGIAACQRVLDAWTGDDGSHIPYRLKASKKALYLPSGSVLEFRSWDREENLSGRTVDVMVIDEAHLITHRVREILEMRMAATLGPRRWIGNATVVGSEFWSVCQEAAEPGNAHRMRFKHWQWEDRYKALRRQRLYPEAEAYRTWVMQRKARMLDSEFDRAFCANWAVADEMIFSGFLDQVFVQEWSETPHPGHDYVIATDIGLVQDYTVAVPLCWQCRSATAYFRERGNSVGLPDRLAAFYRRWNNGTAVIETQNAGQMVLDHVRAIYPKAQGWSTNEENKRQAIMQWIELAKTHALTLPKEHGIIEEHRAFQSKRKTDGTWTFGAPSGGHDDRVMATVIAVGAMTTGAAAFLRTMAALIGEQKKAEAAHALPAA